MDANGSWMLMLLLGTVLMAGTALLFALLAGDELQRGRPEPAHSTRRETRPSRAPATSEPVTAAPRRQLPQRRYPVFVPAPRP